MRLTPSMLTAILALGSFAVPSGAEPPPAAAPSAEDLLGNIVVVAGAGRPLPKIAVVPSLAADMEDVTLHTVVRRDLDLSGEFELIAESAAPESALFGDGPVDVIAWAKKGAEAVVRVTGKRLEGGRADLRAELYLVKHGDRAVLDRRVAVPMFKVREASHRLADALIGALTGHAGSFASHLAFASGSGRIRRVFTVDADGHDPKAVSTPDLSAIAPAFGEHGEVHYAAAAPNDDYRVVTANGAVVPIPYKGSVYGIAFSRDHAQVAISLGVGSTVKVFAGPSFSTLRPASDVGSALHPTFTPSGKLAFVGEGKAGQRVYVGNEPISPDGLFASSPTFCNHPDGVRAVFAVGVGKDTDLLSTGEKGGALVRLTQHQGKNGSPACSPDGRLVAFFSTRASGGGPGLYVMRLDGGRPKRISPILGDSLRWDALPPPPAEPR